ncbi:MAG: 50S ribosomal protein L11 methyltransferase [Chloroflexota bacterium]|nr:50S ribosomal protein L11 methyltransferase [Chloroflexota bacterium]MDE2683898.1 50S ribosomal protein L11 methyltransferase [Chloroflexota bacterium]
MSWHELSITVPFEYVEPVSYLFERYGYGLSVETRPGEHAVLRSYLPSLSRQRLAHIEVGIKLASSVAELGELQITPLGADEDWRDSWKQHFTLLRVGKNLVIKPSWIEYEERAGDVVIDLDPGLAFGTGYHPTTYSCLEALEELVKPGHLVLDVGTGSGILAIAAARLGAAHITAVDIDGHAVRAARKNFRRTGISDLVSAESGSIPGAVTRGRTYDVAVANISARGIRIVAPAIPDLLAPGGVFIASGVIVDQHDEAHSAVTDAGLVVDEIRQREDWLTILCRHG